MRKPDSIQAIERRMTAATSSFTSNARQAMKRNPDYFVWWYTVKSVGLAVAVGFAAYYAGKTVGMKEPRL